MKNIALILGAFHKKEAEEMLDEARKVSANFGFNITHEIWVHGSYEIPYTLKKLFLKDNVDGAAILGIIEKGETKHGLVMAEVVMGKIKDLELEFLKPTGIGVLGPEIQPSQIPSRVRPYAREAIVALHMIKESGI